MAQQTNHHHGRADMIINQINESTDYRSCTADEYERLSTIAAKIWDCFLNIGLEYVALLQCKEQKQEMDAIFGGLLPHEFVFMDGHVWIGYNVLSADKIKENTNTNNKNKKSATQKQIDKIALYLHDRNKKWTQATTGNTTAKLKGKSRKLKKTKQRNEIVNKNIESRKRKATINSQRRIQTTNEIATQKRSGAKKKQKEKIR